MAIGSLPLSFILGIFLLGQITRLFACDSTPRRLTAKEGTLMSEVELAQYQKPTICIWVIDVPPNRRIELIVRVFEIKTACCSCKEDFVQFRDGLNSSSPLIGRYCARSHPERVYSSGNTLRVEYFSSGKQHARNMSSVNKFRAKYRTICGSFIRGRSGRITSPGFPYFSRARCLYTVLVPYGWVKLTFTNFTVGAKNKQVDFEQCEKDFVKIKETSLVEFKDPQRLALCGRLFSQHFYSSSGRLLSVLYKSTGKYRFSARFEAVTSSSEGCGGLLTRNYGYIYSPGYPKEYPSDTECQWKIEVTHGRFVELRFLIFNFSETSPMCDSGKLEIFDGWSDSAIKICTYCGIIKNPPHVISRTNRLLVRARSAKGTHTGIFLLSYQAVEHGLCGTDEFSCASRTCVVLQAVCDGVNDCGDGSDELNCPSKKGNKTLYVVWVIIVLIATVLMVFWLWQTWKKAVRHIVVIQHRRCNTNVDANDYACEVPSQSGAPPSYSEALRQTRTTLPSYEDAVCHNDEAQTVMLQRNSCVRFNNHPNNFNSASSHMARTHNSLNGNVTDV